MQVTKHNVVLINYTLKNDSGEVLDTSSGGDPLGYIHGIGNLIPGLENALEGKKKGDQLQVSIAPADAYGQKEAANIKAVPRNQFPDPNSLEVGMQFEADLGEGPRVFTITGLEDGEVMLDGNHPLAGETLHFSVEVLDIRKATAEEISHGHVHGHGGHHH